MYQKIINTNTFIIHSNNKKKLNPIINAKKKKKN